MKPKDYSAPTLLDVAKVAGVSTATVSRCLNDPDKVSATTRARVESAVESLGYTPHFGARVMAARRSHTIGAIIPTMDNAIFAKGLQAFQEQLHELGYTLLVASSAYSPDREAEQIRSLVTRGADGLLLIGYERDEAMYEFLRRRQIPTLVSWAFQHDAPTPSVGFDNRASMRALAELVLSKGHRRISYISGIISGNDRATERLKGLKDALSAAGLDPDEMPVVETTYSIDSGAQAFAKLMDTKMRPTVVMCANDVLAAGALKQARDLQLDVPSDVSITGFDDIELARISVPPLTTVHVPHRQMGQQAAKELIRMVEDRSSNRSARLESSVLDRSSLRNLGKEPNEGL